MVGMVLGLARVARCAVNQLTGVPPRMVQGDQPLSEVGAARMPFTVGTGYSTVGPGPLSATPRGQVRAVGVSRWIQS